MPLPTVTTLPTQKKQAGLTVRLLIAALTVSLCISMVGCGTTTQRVGTEQLLLSNVVDKAVGQIDFSYLEGKSVFLDTKFMAGVSTSTMVDSNYVTSSMRHQLTAYGALVQESAGDAEIIIEPRIGALGTDGHDVTYGIPQSGALSSAAAVFSSSAIPVIPEISFGHSDAKSGIAKIIIYAYERETRKPVWQSGVASAESDSSNTWVLGAGPFQKGSIYDGYRFAGKKISNRHQMIAPGSSEPNDGNISYHQAHIFQKAKPPVEDAVDKNEAIEDSEVQLASHEEEVGSDEPASDNNPNANKAAKEK